MSYKPHWLASIPDDRSFAKKKPDDRCVSSLNKLGFRMGSSRTETALAIKALRNIDIDRFKVTPKKEILKKIQPVQIDHFELSEEEDAESDNALLAHSVWDISEVYFDDEALDTKICDLMASPRKSRTSKKKAKN
jgi:hypothetical protein